MIAERRMNRSDMIPRALEFQLRACAQRGGLRAMLISDRDGFLVAGSPWSTEASEELAALLPLLARDGRFSGIILGEGSVGHAVQVETFDTEGDDLFVCAVGRVGDGVGAEIETAISGARRILA